MATYISTIRFSDQGIKTVGNTTQRAKEVHALAEEMDVQVRETYWTLGDHDGLIIFDAHDEATATALMLKVSSAGNVHTSTARAFTSSEMDQVLARAKL